MFTFYLLWFMVYSPTDGHVTHPSTNPAPVFENVWRTAKITTSGISVVSIFQTTPSDRLSATIAEVPVLFTVVFLHNLS